MNSRCAFAAWLECFQEKPSWCRNEQVCQGRKSVKHFERSNVLDTALYKAYLFFTTTFYGDSFSKVVGPTCLVLEAETCCACSS